MTGLIKRDVECRMKQDRTRKEWQEKGPQCLTKLQALMVNFIARIRLSSGVLTLYSWGKERESQASDRTFTFLVPILPAYFLSLFFPRDHQPWLSLGHLSALC